MLRGEVLHCTPAQGMLDDSMDIYATTASNAYESSWGTYCPGMTPPPPPELTTCMGDLYSVAWLENRCPLQDHPGTTGPTDMLRAPRARRPAGCVHSEECRVLSAAGRPH